MSKQLNVDLRFNADVSQAKAQLQSLQTSLSQLTTSMASQGTQLGITPKIQEAQQAAVQLKTALSQSMNVETGKFDLTKFKSSLTTMNTDLGKLKTQLVSLGPSGQQTFMALAQSIMTAEIPTKRISASIAALGTTLKNTAKWQLSSSMLHGFTSAVRTAYNYAQDLNESLNNIRIVTGESAEAMDKFAAKANKAAQKLSASTLDYTNAALILYQQGLSDDQVEKRAEVMIKMANVTGQTAETVSDQMTAVWNNFYDGSKSLEYYADVLTALGAATASSTDEIAGGLEKFAAIGNTIGLSYEYAAASLATITAQTRQSEEVVGTALKTIFARIQGLKLGETLEDGTELNKYSEALQSVGISIFNQNNQLKDMDTILDEMGAKWDTLSRAQQTALAQTVAGVRQYTQLITLMDNWDTMQKNVGIAENSTGTLQNQADIYAESWEGASKRVKSAIEEVYTDLLDDDFFIKITNGLADVLGLLDNFLDAMGGAKGLLTGLSSILLNMFAGSAAKGLENMVYNFKSFIGLAQKEAMDFQNYTAQLANETVMLSGSQTNISENQAIMSGATDQINLNHTLLGIKGQLSEQDQLIAQEIMKQNQAYQDQLVKLGQINDAATQQQDKARLGVMDTVIADAGYKPTVANDMISSINKDIELSNQLTSELKEIDVALEAGEMDIQDYINKLKELEQRASEGRLTDTSKYLKSRTTGVDGKQLTEDAMRHRAKNAEDTMNIYGRQDATNNVLGDEGRFSNLTKRDQIDEKAIVKYTEATQDAVKAGKNFSNAQKQVATETERAKGKLLALGKSTKSWSQNVVGAAQAAMSLSFAINSLKSIITTWGDETIGVGEKILQTFMSLGMAIPMLMNGLKGVSSLLGITAAKQASVAAMNTLMTQTQAALTGELTAETVARMTGLGVKESEILLQQIKAKGLLEEAAAQGVLDNAIMQGMVLQTGAMTQDQLDIVIAQMKNGKTFEEAAAIAGVNLVKKAGILTAIKLTLAKWAEKTAVDAENASLWANVAAWIASYLASLPVGVAILIIVAALAALIGIIALAVIGINGLIDAYNADALAMERANEALVEQQEILKNTKQAHEELIEAIKNYEDAYTALQGMTKGTKEWEEQAEALNKTVTDLIIKYPELAKLVKRSSDGVLTLDKKGLEEFSKASEKKVTDAEIRTSEAQRRANTAKQKSDITDMSRLASKEFGFMDYMKVIGDNMMAGMATGAMFDLATGGTSLGAGTITGAIAGLVGGIGDAIYKDFQQADIAEEALQGLIGGYETGGEAYLADSNTLQEIDKLATMLGTNREAIIELIRSNDELNATNRLLIEQEVDDQFKDDQVYQQSKYQDIMREKAADIKEAQGKVTDQDLKDAKDALFGSNGDDYSDYLKAVYGEDAKNYRVTDTAGYNATVQKYNEETKQWENVSEENGLTQEEAAEIVAQMYANDRAKKKIEEDVDPIKIHQQAVQEEKKFEKMGLSDEAATEIAKAIVGEKDVNFANIKESDLDKIRNYTGNDTQMLEFKEQMKMFDAEGGVLGAKNASFKELWETANQEITDTTTAQVKEEKAQAQQDIAEIQEWYKGLSDTEKQLAAETIDFKKAKNAEYHLTLEQENALLDDMLEKAKEEQAYSKIEGAASAYELDAEVVEAQAKQIQQSLEASNGELENAAELAVEMAIANQRMNKGVDKLTDNWKNWGKTLRGTEKDTQDYAEALVGAEDAVKDILNLSEDAVIPEDFLETPENLDLLDEIANGSEEAVQKLHFNLTKAQIEAETFSTDIAQNMAKAFDLGDDANFEAEFEKMKTAALNALSEIQTMADGLDVGSGLADPAKQAELAGALNDYAMAAGWTAEQMQSALSSVGVSAKITMVEGEPVTKKIPRTHIKRERVNHNPFDGTSEWIESSWVEGYEEIQEPTLVPQIEMVDPDNPSSQNQPIFSKVSMGDIAPSVTTEGKNSGSGGSSSKTPQKKKPIESKKEEDEIERYHEITKTIEDQERMLDRLSKAKDKAYGVNKLKAMDKEIAALKELNNLDSQHLDQIREKLTLDKELAHNYGATFDEFGRINNYDEIIKIKMGQWKSEQDSIQKEEIAYEEKKNNDENYDADGTIKLDIETRKEKSDENYEDFKESLTQYEETMKLFEDTVDRIQDRWDQIADIAVEKITYEIEINVDYHDFELELLDFQISQLGEDFDKFGEITALSVEKLGSLDGTIISLSDGIAKLHGQYQMGEINFDKYLQALKDEMPEILSAMQEFIELDKEMMEYYATAFDAAEEEFSSYLDLIDHGINKLDHFKNLLSILGKENNKQMVGTVLQAQYTTASNRFKASSDWYETTKKEYDALYSRWENIQKNNGMELDAEGNLRQVGEKELEMLEEKLQVALTKMKEADEQRLTDLEAVGEKAQEILQNNLDMAREKFEKSLVGSSLEDYMTDLDRLSKKQEEYLTETNKLYETNKLIRQAQMDMDKTENNRAKQQYNDYVKYIEQLQQSGKLSSYELSIAQAKYDLLQAQIALEEAQDAKNQVRLTRDSEGNYGYVYTANEDKVSSAEQAVADAENKLYNIGLDGAKDYQSKKAETLQEAIDTFADLEEKYQTGEIATEEEFNQKMLEAKNYYYDLLKGYDELYYLSLGTMQEESYSNTLDYELNSTNVFSTFEANVDTYLTEVRSHFTDYDTKVQDVEKEVGGSLDELKTKTSEVTTESGLLLEKTQDLTDEMDNELLAVREVTSAWGKKRDKIYENIEANRLLIEQLREIEELSLGKTQDYAAYLNDLIGQGYGYDNRLVQKVLTDRWEKMGGEDNNNYQQMINDYVTQYANDNNMSFEEAEAALQNDTWYKALKMMRQYKIERTDWAAVEAKIKAEDPNADTSWVQANRDEKLAMDWEGKIRQYVAWNPGVKLDDKYLQEMLGIRQAQIDSRGGAEASGMISNEELIQQLSKNGALIDNRQTPKQEEDGAEEPPAAPVVQAPPAAPGTEEPPADPVVEKPAPVPPSSKRLSSKEIDDLVQEIKNKEFSKATTKAQLIRDLKNQGIVQDDVDLIISKLMSSGGRDLVIEDPPWEMGDKVKVPKGAMGYLAVSESPEECRDNKDCWGEAGKDLVVSLKGKKTVNGTDWYKFYDSEVSKKYWWILSKHLVPLDTGGYTGAWGPEGKMAMLHEKEIVLNKHDTENFLIGIDMLRSISDILDKNALIQSIGMISSEYLTKISDHSDILQQEVTIHADFPNVQDHNEIEIAIDNLINAASQYAYRK